MIHGMWGGSWCWEKYKKFFESKGYTCITPTLRYHNIAPNSIPNKLLGTTSLSDYVDDLKIEVKKLKNNPIIMGHSMGGLIAQILCSQGFAKFLILLAPAAPYGIISIRLSVIKSFYSYFFKWKFWKRPHKQKFKETIYSSLNLLSHREQEKIYKKFVCESGRSIAEIGLSIFDKRKTSDVDENKITCPVLIISGAKDRITPTSVVKKIAKKYQSVSTYKEFINNAHWVIGEPGWENIAVYINNWLDSTLI